LFDERARDRLGEWPLGELQFEGLALALVGGFVAGNERHHHVPAGPGMVGQILGGLPDAALGARLRQYQREVGRLVERTRRLAVGAFARLEREGRLRADNAVVVLELVIELQRAARLRLWILR